MDKNYILGVGVTNAKKEEILEYIVTSLRDIDKKLSIFTPNPEIIMHAVGDDEFKNILNSADLALADGVGVTFAGQLMGKPFKERIAGVDFMLELCKVAEKNGFTVGLLGGGEKIAEKTRDCLLEMYPGLKISFVSSGGKIDYQIHSKDVSSSMYQVSSKEKIHNTKYIIPNTDILFVALGFPKQEKWIFENLPKIDVKVAMAVGGSFDYISGSVPRAPLLIRNLGLEWLFRLIREPWRLKRQLALPKFLWSILREKFF